MPTPRKTPEDDPSRLAERLYQFSNQKIRDKSTFEVWWREYIGDKTTLKQESSLKKKVLKELKRKGKIDEDDIFKQAGGKNLRRDQRTRARIVTRSKKRYRRLGAQRADLYGVDTPNAGRRGGVIRKKQFTVVGRVKKKTVYARKEFVTVKGKKVVRYRDKRGRFVKV